MSGREGWRPPGIVVDEFSSVYPGPYLYLNRHQYDELLDSGLLHPDDMTGLKFYREIPRTTRRIFDRINTSEALGFRFSIGDLDVQERHDGAVRGGLAGQAVRAAQGACSAQRRDDHRAVLVGTGRLSEIAVQGVHHG